MALVSLHHLATAYGRPPASWVLDTRQLASPEGHIFAFDFDRAVYAIGSTYDAEQSEMTRRSIALKRKVLMP